MDDADLPIDIHCSKLLNWLLTRGHIRSDWQQRVQSIRENISNALQDMPEHEEIVKLLSDTVINYFHCLRIVEILRDTEADSKNIFGFYSSQRMKDWQAIVKAYQQDNVYLAESATILQRLVQYELPTIKKKMTKIDASIEDAKSHRTECEKRMKQLERELTKKLEDLDLNSDQNIEEDLQSQTNQLDDRLNQVFESNAELLKTVTEACTHYQRSAEGCIVNIETLPLLNKLLNSKDEMGNLKDSKRFTLVDTELKELISYLRLRQHVLSTDHPSDLILVNQQRLDEDFSLPSIIKWLNAVDSFRSRLNDSKIKHLRDVLCRPRYVEQIVDQFDQLRRQREKLEEQVVDNQSRVDSLRADLATQNALLAATVKSTRQLQRQLEAEISKKYNCRQVNIMGNISTVMG